jgi:hypothetical protein
MLLKNTVNELNFRLDAAGAGEAPAAQGFVDGEQAGDHKNQTEPQAEIHQDDAGDEAERANNAPRDAAIALDVWAKELAHDGNLAQSFSVASHA